MFRIYRAFVNQNVQWPLVDVQLIVYMRILVADRFQRECGRRSQLDMQPIPSRGAIA
jgi:hypothetical protein